MCAGVQKLSRPIVRCHEMSHRIPMAMLVPPITTASAWADNCAAGAEDSIAGSAAGGAEAIRVSVSIVAALLRTIVLRRAKPSKDKRLRLDRSSPLTLHALTLHALSFASLSL